MLIMIEIIDTASKLTFQNVMQPSRPVFIDIIEMIIRAPEDSEFLRVVKRISSTNQTYRF